MTDDRVKSAFAGSETLLERNMIDQVRLAWRLFRDPRVGWLKNAIPLFALLYFLWPIDVLPDFLPGVGQLDDLGIVVACIVLMVQALPKIAPDWLLAEHLDAMGLRQRAADAPSAVTPAAVFDVPYRVRE
ncbi:MAG TPA: DUF1232 domain-containing protein [Thermomicrobiales bacterium]|jgi:uncharacterized membrane protein YkvA (DUF1232 family)|nr:DUF1232 domain-containing protein [Thermomicrobiales bacterium]